MTLVVRRSYPSAEVQSVYSTVPADWAILDILADLINVARSIEGHDSSSDFQLLETFLQDFVNRSQRINCYWFCLVWLYGISTIVGYLMPTRPSR